MDKQGTKSFLLSDSPVLQELFLQPNKNDHPRVDEKKIRRLYVQASSQQWFPPTKLDFEQPLDMSEEERRVWIRFMEVFYTLEKMGLNVIANMASKASRRLHSEETMNYLAIQTADESRHVFAIEAYLKRLGAPPEYDYRLHVLGQAASVGLYRVENWLFSTLFSENFASVFLRRARTAKIDTLGADMCKNLLIDESRHIHFLHIVLPDILDRLSLFGRTYVKASQFFIMKFTEMMARTLDKDAGVIGLDRRALLEEVFENVERAYEGFGVTRSFLPFPKIASVH